MEKEQIGAIIEGRRNPITGEEVILIVKNQEKGIVAGFKKFIRWPIKLSDADVTRLQKKTSEEEKHDLWGI